MKQSELQNQVRKQEVNDNDRSSNHITELNDDQINQISGGLFEGTYHLHLLEPSQSWWSWWD